MVGDRKMTCQDVREEGEEPSVAVWCAVYCFIFLIVSRGFLIFVDHKQRQGPASVPLVLQYSSTDNLHLPMCVCLKESSMQLPN